MNISSWLMMYNKYVASSSVHVMSKSCVTWPQALHVKYPSGHCFVQCCSICYTYAIRTPGTPCVVYIWRPSGLYFFRVFACCCKAIKTVANEATILVGRSNPISYREIFAKIPFPLQKKFSRFLARAIDHAPLSSPGYRGRKMSRGKG